MGVVQLILDKTPRRVYSFESVDTLNVKTSVSNSQHKPRLRCVGRASVPNSSFFKSLARSTGGKAFRTSSQLELNLWSLTPQCARHFVSYPVS